MRRLVKNVLVKTSRNWNRVAKEREPVLHLGL